MHCWSELPPGLKVAVVFAVAVTLLAIGELVLATLEARHSLLLSEQEARGLQRDQYRAERRRKLRQLQRRLGLRRSA